MVMSWQMRRAMRRSGLRGRIDRTGSARRPILGPAVRRTTGLGVGDDPLASDLAERYEDGVLDLLAEPEIVERDHVRVRLRLRVADLAVRPAHRLIGADPVLV